MAPKSVLITGCSAGGIGSALVEAFQKKGFHVFATARSTSKMEPLAALDNVTLLQLDVTSRESIEEAVSVVKKQTGGTLDVLVNNSGAAYSVPALDADLQATRDMFEVNFFGTVLPTQLFAPLVIAAKGSIVNICSTAAHAHPPWMGESLSLSLSVSRVPFSQIVRLSLPVLTRMPVPGMYSASKAAQEIFSETLRLEMKTFDVKVLSVVTGGVQTNVAANSAHFQLREGSFYVATEKELTRQSEGKSSFAGEPAPVFADKIVGDVLRGATGRVWRGKMASIVWFMTSWFPEWLLVSHPGDGQLGRECNI